jgi:hypothetical protein
VTVGDIYREKDGTVVENINIVNGGPILNQIVIEFVYGYIRANQDLEELGWEEV